MKSTVVSDTTALIVLSKLDQFSLLSNVFERVVIPHIVYEELTLKEAVVLPSFFQIEPVLTQEITPDLLVLDAGEAQAIALASRLKLPLLIDEKKGRKIAQHQGVAIFGTIGLIIINTQRGFISPDAALALLDALASVNFRLSDTLKAQAKTQLLFT
jgi:predicted nucleic acid-binding protein